MATISFKNVGYTAQKTLEDAASTAASPIAIGVKTPLELSTDGLIKMHFDLSDQLTDNLRNLLLTNWGERLGQYFFGANLKPLTTEFVSQDNFDSEAVVRIKAAVTNWMPYIELIDFLSEVDRLENASTGVIRVTISYAIPQLNINNKKIQIVLYVL
jgi:phage baseplate assembly protein W